MNIMLHPYPFHTPNVNPNEFKLPKTTNGVHTDLVVLHDSLGELISFIAERTLFTDSLFDDMDFINDIYFELFGNPYKAEFGGNYCFVRPEYRMEGLLKVIDAIDYIAGSIEPLRCNVEYEKRFYTILIHYRQLATTLYACTASTIKKV